jgi:DNA segregation ATPase FtsK/SpoIIIE, S-DNA-T family
VAEELISGKGEATGVPPGDAGWPDPHRAQHPENPADQVVSSRAEVSAGPRYPGIATSPADGFRVHRPERAWPHAPQPAPIELIAPPAPPEGTTSRMASLLPMLGSLAMVGLAFLIHSLVYLVVIGGMVLAMVGGGLATTISQRRSRTKRWTRTTQRYAAHLADVRARAAAAAVAQRDALQACFPDPASLITVAARGDGLWERRPADDDFAAVRLGRGRVAAHCPARVARDEGPLAEADPDLAAEADKLVAETATLSAVPIVVPLRDAGCVAIVGESDRSRALAGAWLAGLATFHPPAELRIMGLFPLEAVRTWSWLKWLPHTRDPEAGEGLGRVGRAVTADPVAFAAQFEALAQRRMDSLRRRMEAAAGSLVSGNDMAGRPDSAVAAESAHVIVVVDGYRPGAGPASLDTLMPLAASVGMTIVVLVRDVTQVPASCGARVDWTAPNTVRYVASGPHGRVESGVVPDSLDLGAATQLARTLAPLGLRAGETGADLADPVRLVELLGADDADELDLSSDWIGLERLADGVPPEFLAVPIGRRDNGSTMMLDFKEAAAGGMGPHGMLVGATGSGKSELLRSLTAALAARHDPSLVNLLLIDFKGGAAFADLAGLPHVAGLVTNLADDLSLVDRMRLALGGELARRQEQLRLAGNLGSIADYQAARASGAQLDPLPYLVVVVDEFGELLAAKPDFVDTFLTLARLGRSLGVHLLLATQRLDEGRIRGLEPHLRYRLCLRTFTAEESRAVLSNAAAFELPSLPGLGYLRVDREQARFKAAICGTARVAQSGDTLTDASGLAAPGSLLRPLSLGGTSAQDGQVGPVGPRAADLQVLVEQAQAAAASPARQIWTLPLPADLTLSGLDALVGGGGTPAERSANHDVTIGIADWPERQAKEAVRYRPDGAGGNVGIAGAPRTGKSTLLQSLVLALAASQGPERRQFYCLDLGGGSLFELEGLPHVGAIVGRGETEAAARLFRELRALLDERASVRQASRSGSRAENWPDVFLVVDNVGQLRQSAPDLEPELTELATAGLPFGLHVLLSANRWLDVRPQLLDALGTRWELHLADPADSLAGRQAAQQVAVDMPGRGVIRDGHLFQAVLPDLSPEPSPSGLTAAIAATAESAGKARAPKIAPLPLRVTAAEAAKLALVAGSQPPADDGGFLLGVSEFRGRPAQLDLARPGNHLLVYGDSGSGRTTLLRRITASMRNQSAGELSLCIADPARGLLDIADGDEVFGYAANIGAAEKLAGRLAGELLPRVAPEDASVADMREGKWWTGPRYVLVVDDYDLLIGQLGGPFTMLTDLLAQGSDIGFSVILARRVAGSQRTAYEQFGQRLREVAPTALILSGQPDEGPLVGGVSARQWPPGRGILIPSRARPQLIQCCIDADEPEPRSKQGRAGRDGHGAT